MSPSPKLMGFFNIFNASIDGLYLKFRGLATCACSCLRFLFGNVEGLKISLFPINVNIALKNGAEFPTR